MVRAILEGRKTQTRRIALARTQNQAAIMDDMNGDDDGTHEKAAWQRIGCPYGKVADRLWVKETWKSDPAFGYPPHIKPTEIAEGTNILYRATLDPDHTKATWGTWKPSLFMRRWMSRITLEITAIRVERLNEITEADAKAEGCDPGLTGVKKCHGWTPYVLGYSLLWDSINGPDSWQKNPFVWVIEFKPISA